MSSPSTSSDSPSPAKRRRTGDKDADQDPVKHAYSLLLPTHPVPSEEAGKLVVALQDLLVYVKNLEKEANTIQAETMDMYDVLTAFGLKEEEEIGLWVHRPVEVPAWTLESMEHTTEVTLDGSKRNEVYGRLIINQVLIAAIYVQSRRHELAEAEHSGTAPPAALGLRFEVALQEPAIVQGKEVIIEGIADYAIFRHDAGEIKSAASLIALEAKKRYCAGSEIPQLAAYMGIIHRRRKVEGKKNCVVWGFASDGVEFRFCRIDNDGFFSLAKALEFVGPEREMIFGMLCGIVKATALSSRTSPEENPELEYHT